MGEGAKRGEVPSLRRVGPEKDELGRHGAEVAFLVGGRGRAMPVIDDAVYG